MLSVMVLIVIGMVGGLITSSEAAAFGALGDVCGIAVVGNVHGTDFNDVADRADLLPLGHDTGL